jgi:hypothetical protein
MGIKHVSLSPKVDQEMVCDWDFKIRKAELNVGGTKLYHDQLDHQDKLGKEGSAVIATFCHNGKTLRARVQTIWWGLVSGEGKSSTSGVCRPSDCKASLC